MDRPLITVPPDVFRATSADWDIDWREVSAGIGTGGRNGILVGQLPRWIGGPGLVIHADTLRDWRAHRWAGRGQTGVYRLTMVDPIGLSAMGFNDPGPGLPAGVPFDGPEPFAGGAGFEHRWQVPIIGAAPAGAGEIVVDESALPAGLHLRVGQILSHDDWPFGVTSRMAEETAGHYRLTVEMPLRRAIPDGALIDLAATGLFELVGGSGNPGYGLDRVSRPTLQLQEWLR